MIYEVRNIHEDVIYKTEIKQLAEIQKQWLKEQNPKLEYFIWECRKVEND